MWNAKRRGKNDLHSAAQRTSSTNINFPAKHGLSAIEVEAISKRIHQIYDEISTMDPTFFETVASTDDRLEPVVEGEDVGILGLGSIDGDHNCLF